MKNIEAKSSRRRFLRQLAIGLGAGLGVLAAPALAKAEENVYLCCPALPSQCPGDPCPSGQVRYHCQCSQYGYPPDYCTDCQAQSNCYDSYC